MVNLEMGEGFQASEIQVESRIFSLSSAVSQNFQHLRVNKCREEVTIVLESVLEEKLLSLVLYMIDKTSPCDVNDVALKEICEHGGIHYSHMYLVGLQFGS